MHEEKRTRRVKMAVTGQVDGERILGRGLENSYRRIAGMMGKKARRIGSGGLKFTCGTILRSESASSLAVGLGRTVGLDAAAVGLFLILVRADTCDVAYLNDVSECVVRR